LVGWLVGELLYLVVVFELVATRKRICNCRHEQKSMLHCVTCVILFIAATDCTRYYCYCAAKSVMTTLLVVARAMVDYY